MGKLFQPLLRDQTEIALYMCLKLRCTDVFLESAHSLTPTLEFIRGKSIKIVEWFLQRTVKHRRKLNSFSVSTKQKSQPGEYLVCRLKTAANCFYKANGIYYSTNCRQPR